MEKSRMTLRQLYAAVLDQEAIHVQSRGCYGTMQSVELTDYVRAFNGVMGLEVFKLTHSDRGYIAEVDMPPEVIAALAANAENPV